MVEGITYDDSRGTFERPDSPEQVVATPETMSGSLADLGSRVAAAKDVLTTGQVQSATASSDAEAVRGEAAAQQPASVVDAAELRLQQATEPD